MDVLTDEERARIVLDGLTDPDAYGAFKEPPLRGETAYQLMMLGDAATSVLLRALDSELVGARREALSLLRRYGSDDALEPLAKGLASEPDRYTQSRIWSVLAELGADHASEVALSSLDASPPLAPSDVRCQILADNGDLRATPYLREFLGDEPHAHRAAAEMLAKLGDADGVTALIELWESLDDKKDRKQREEREKIFGALSHSGDERVIPIAMWTLRSSAHAISGSPMPRDFGSRLAPHLLRGVRHAGDTYLTGLDKALQTVHEGRGSHGWKGAAPLPEHADLYGRALLKLRDEVGPRPRSTPATKLRRTLAQALASLGDEGRGLLRRGAHDPRAYRESLAALASYNDVEAVDELANLALDASYPYRKDALTAFASVAWLWEEAAAGHWRALLADRTISAADACLTYISRGRPGNAAALLNVLMEHDDEVIRERASRLHGAYVENPGKDVREDLEVQIALDKETYAYDDDITLSVRVTNAGSMPVTISTWLFDAHDYMSEHIKLELVMPDGGVRVFPNHGFGPSGPGKRQTLQPKESVSTTVDIQAHCRPAQAGAYNITVSYGHPGNFMKQGRRYVRSPVAVSPTVAFVLRPPSPAYVDGLLAEIDVNNLTDESLYAAPVDGRARLSRVVNRKRRDPEAFRSIATPIYQLGELRERRAIGPLRALATLPDGADGYRHSHDLARIARRALAQYDAPELLPLWLDALTDRGDRNNIAERRVAAIGDLRALRPLREHALNSGVVAAAEALAQLGDTSALRFLHWDAIRGMDAADESTWRGSKALALLLPGEDWVDRLRHEQPGVRKHAVSTASQEGRVDVLAAALGDADARVRLHAVEALAAQYVPLNDDTGKHAMCVDALKQALADAEPHIRRAAAISLANEGSDAGEELLRADLHAVDCATRVAARSALVNLRRRR